MNNRFIRRNVIPFVFCFFGLSCNAQQNETRPLLYSGSIDQGKLERQIDDTFKGIFREIVSLKSDYWEYEKEITRKHYVIFPKTDKVGSRYRVVINILSGAHLIDSEFNWVRCKTQGPKYFEIIVDEGFTVTKWLEDEVIPEIENFQRGASFRELFGVLLSLDKNLDSMIGLPTEKVLINMWLRTFKRHPDLRNFRISNVSEVDKRSPYCLNSDIGKLNENKIQLMGYLTVPDDDITIGPADFKCIDIDKQFPSHCAEVVKKLKAKGCIP